MLHIPAQALELLHVRAAAAKAGHVPVIWRLTG
jgi:hypothetical protein